MVGKRFFVLAAVAIYGTFGFLYARDGYEGTRNLYAIFQHKAETAARAQGESRILLAGGSNMVWGMRSKVIEEETMIPTFNLALIHEAFDPELMRNLVLAHVRRGDIVVYGSISFWNARSKHETAAGELMAMAGLGKMSLWQRLSVYWLPFPRRSVLARAFGTWWSQPPLMASMNERGDIRTCEKYVPTGSASFVPPVDREELLKHLQAYRDALASQGAQLVLLLPPILVTSEERDRWKKEHLGLRQSMKQHFLVADSGAEIFCTDEKLFCDTGFHLGNAEAEKRSHALGLFLKQIGSQASARNHLIPYTHPAKI